MFLEQNENGLIYMRSDRLPVRHAFTTRYGGVSRGEWATLNLASSRGDDPEAVVPYEADGLVTAERGLPLLCFVADCVPVLLADPEAGVAAAVHCGWRSSVADILGIALEKMRGLGASPARIRAAIGPSIGPCCFETDRDVPDAVSAWLGGAEGLVTARADGKYLVDLRGANARRLRQLGVPEAQIDVSDECTFCRHDKYWSHRWTRGRRGSQAAGIVL